MNWKAIDGYDGYYEVSDTGIVRGLDRIVPDLKIGTRYIKGRIMKLSESKGRDCNSGYLVVNLRKLHTSNVKQVHRLVAETFIPNDFCLPTVNHKDGNKQNNNVSNLEWVTYSENNSQAINTGLRKPRGKGVIQKTLDDNEIAIYKSVCDASRQTGIGRSIISHCVNHRVLSAGGYKWQKVEECNDYSNIGSTTDDELPLEAQELCNAEDIVCTDRNI